jgi:hypothetical protein
VIPPSINIDTGDQRFCLDLVTAPRHRPDL